MTTHVFTCQWCGDEFRNNWSTALYCCRSCRTRATSHRRNCPNGDGCTTHPRLNKGRHRTPPLELVMRYVDTSGGPESCWEWTGWRNEWGYGQAKITEDGRQRSQMAHRAVYEMTQGVTLPADSLLLHQCDNPPCCNPAHLRPGTQIENMRDRLVRGAGYVRGADHPLAVPVTDEVVASIRADYRFRVKGRGAPALAEKYGIGVRTVEHIVNRTGRWAESGCRADEIAAKGTSA